VPTPPARRSEFHLLASRAPERRHWRRREKLLHVSHTARGWFHSAKSQTGDPRTPAIHGCCSSGLMKSLCGWYVCGWSMHAGGSAGWRGNSAAHELTSSSGNKTSQALTLNTRTHSCGLARIYSRAYTPHAYSTRTATQALGTPSEFAVGALRRLDWTWEQVGDWTNRTYVCVNRSVVGVGVSVGPSIAGRDWKPGVSCNKAARGYHCCRTPGDHRAPLRPGRAARRYLRARGTSRADSRRCGARLAPGPQVLLAHASSRSALWFNI
jgi:hypothetical protein